jgi:hypothetical protein
VNKNFVKILSPMSPDRPGTSSQGPRFISAEFDDNACNPQLRANLQLRGGMLVNLFTVSGLRCIVVAARAQKTLALRRPPETGEAEARLGESFVRRDDRR